jgi:hypothetical protein
MTDLRSIGSREPSRAALAATRFWTLSPSILMPTDDRFVFYWREAQLSRAALAAAGFWTLSPSILILTDC